MLRVTRGRQEQDDDIPWAGQPAAASSQSARTAVVFVSEARGNRDITSQTTAELRLSTAPWGLTRNAPGCMPGCWLTSFLNLNTSSTRLPNGRCKL